MRPSSRRIPSLRTSIKSSHRSRCPISFKPFIMVSQLTGRRPFPDNHSCRTAMHAAWCVFSLRFTCFVALLSKRRTCASFSQ